jgi:hypothetical protein
VKRPGIGTYLIGNPLSALALTGLTGWLAWQWYIGELSGLVPIAVGIVTISAFDAFRRIGEYKLWQREWNAMEGRAPTPRPLPRIRLNLAMRLLVGAPLWLAGAYGALHAGNDPLVQIAAALFWLGTLLAAGAVLYRWRKRTPATPNVSRNPRVTHCISVPSVSVPIVQAILNLPGYCRLILTDD